jgi:hypothetical protein
MTPFPDQNEKLEHLIHRTLRDQPLRRAPRSLESRVLAALAQRAALPWYRQDFARWPAAARGAFLVASAALAAALVWGLGGFDLQQSTNTVVAGLSWLETARNITNGIANFGAIIFRSISPVWLYSAAAAVVTLYVALFGLGTAAYRTLLANRAE